MSDAEDFQAQMDAAGVRRLHGVPALPPLDATPAALPAVASIPPRRWLMGTTAIRSFISLLVAPGGVGKTTYAVAACLACASGRPLLGDHVFAPAPAWLLNLEDPLDEMERRVAAAMIHHGVGREEVAGRLFLNSGRDRPLLIAAQDGTGGRVVHPDKERLVGQARTHSMGLIVVDPFANSHGLEENSNPHMNAAARAWAEVAHAADCAVLLVHHTRKGAAGKAGDIEDARGGKALSDAARVGLTLAAMTPDEAGRCGVAAGERWRHVRLDDGKANLAPSAERARWFRLVGVNLGNGTPEYPGGDNVQAMEAWTAPSAFGDLTDGELNAVLDRIEAGIGGGRLYNDSRRGGSTRWAGQILVKEHGRTEEQAKAIIAAWLQSGLLWKDTYTDPVKGRDEEGLRVDPGKRPGTQHDP